MTSAAPLREVAYTLFLHSLAMCSVEQAFARTVKSYTSADGNRLLTLGQSAINLSRLRRVRIVAAGKAAAVMLDALLPHLQGMEHIDLGGVLITSYRPTTLPAGFEFFAGGHPLPNEASVAGARAALHLVASLQEAGTRSSDALCLFLISGGASAMVELPLDSEITLEDTVVFYRELVNSGASIAEINCVRKHFSAVKGGRLAMQAAGIFSYSLLVSDVPAGHLDALGSGLTLPDTSTVEQCREILVRYKMMKRFPLRVRQFLESPELPETPKPHELDAKAITLLTSDDVAESARQQAEELGFYAVIDNTCDDWDYRLAASYLLDRLRELRREHARVCLISSGEVTVELPDANSENDTARTFGRPGVGGRNQHFALYAATLLQPSDTSVVVFSAGTDGVDGNSLAAGGVVDRNTLLSASDLSHATDTVGVQTRRAEAAAALARFDSGTFLASIGSIVSTGPTGNNLRDLRILLAD